MNLWETHTRKIQTIKIPTEIPWGESLSLTVTSFPHFLLDCFPWNGGRGVTGWVVQVYGHVQLLFSRSHPPCVLRQGLLLESGAHWLIRLDWLASKPRDPPVCFYLSSTGDYMCVPPHPVFLCGCCGLNSGGWAANTTLSYLPSPDWLPLKYTLI